MSYDFSHSTILLTGAGGGIGFAVLKQLLRSKARVIATDISLSALQEKTKKLHHDYPGQLICREMDLAVHRATDEYISCWEAEYGPIHHLVSCAGLLHVHPLRTMPVSDIQDMFDVNVFGTLALMQAAGKKMAERQQGNMVIIGSNAANTPRAGIGAYAASKSALHMMVKCMGMELAPFGIRCNIVSPGSTRTHMQQQLWTENYGESQVIAGDAENFRLGIPLGKIAEPDDIAGTVLFLLSEAANHITLHDLRVDGGATLDQ
ncbi:2,3-dihydro-2,3-dihydroxybenzoate dehydrogenase [Vibrio aerogenes CECT 7868]|uniref:2,3-dihydro-2,3-dihydroxybenzoate dehydrogenase n=1 Tax=Vibrio aerogenes CECT 7868 TaxID=1216006 RepID=A0A1M6AKQ8_9VIBR|nr:2,3-dihydro-2,3-dihydroxybenzoate dehydrogenase [Vibrio aerogenes]SHI37099.1 2,3-dihydro-2,3-dihydroxybenzoate dehydrogenase [Vibrio aerogenes CECT 7868]